MAADTPVIWYPRGSPTGVRLDEPMQFIKNPYSGAGTQREVQWQVASDSGFGAATIVFDTDLRENDDHWLGDDWVDFIFPNAVGPLAANTTYYVRCRVRNTSSETSNWSSTVQFTTEATVGTAADWRAAQ